MQECKRSALKMNNLIKNIKWCSRTWFVHFIQPLIKTLLWWQLTTELHLVFVEFTETMFGSLTNSDQILLNIRFQNDLAFYSFFKAIISIKFDKRNLFIGCVMSINLCRFVSKQEKITWKFLKVVKVLKKILKYVLNNE